jgi:CheY-like chemotaxis protein
LLSEPLSIYLIHVNPHLFFRDWILEIPFFNYICPKRQPLPKKIVEKKMKQTVIQLNRPVVFLADDDKDDVYFIRTAFREIDAHLEIKSFSNGVELLKALEVEVSSPAFILLDLNMPLLDGRETLRSIRQKWGAELPVIVLTNSNHQHERDLCFEYGATAYFTKPLSYPLYVEILRQVKEEFAGTIMV